MIQHANKSDTMSVPKMIPKFHKYIHICVYLYIFIETHNLASLKPAPTVGLNKELDTDNVKNIHS